MGVVKLKKKKEDKGDRKEGDHCPGSASVQDWEGDGKEKKKIRENLVMNVKC